VDHDDEASGSTGRPVVTVRVVEAAVAAVMLAVGTVLMVQSRRLGAGWTSDGPGSGYFPFYISLIIVVSSCVILVQALVGKNRNTGVFVDTVQGKRVLSVLLPAIAYVLAIVFLGLYVASALYIALFMITLGHYHWAKSVVAALVINALLFFMFELWFKVPLYKGTLDPLRFIGGH
jgi:hypothetical protein